MYEHTHTPHTVATLIFHPLPFTTDKEPKPDSNFPQSQPVGHSACVWLFQEASVHRYVCVCLCCLLFVYLFVFVNVTLEEAVKKKKNQHSPIRICIEVFNSFGLEFSSSSASSLCPVTLGTGPTHKSWSLRIYFQPP